MKTPKSLSRESAQFFKKIAEEYSISDEAGIRLLFNASQALDIIEKCKKQIDADGMMVVDRFQQKKAHPLLATMRDANATFLHCLKSLNLDLEPILPVGRPSGGRRV